MALIRRGSLAGVLVAASLTACPGLGSCQLVRDYLTYRELLAHEREFAGVELSHARLEVDLEPEQARAVIRAHVVLENGADHAIDSIRLLIAEAAVVSSVRDEQGPLEHETEVVRLKDKVARLLEVRLREPIAAASAGSIDIAYELRCEAPTSEARLDRDGGHLRIESLWAPTLHTPLAARGLDRESLELSVTLPEDLVPIALPELVCTARSNGRATHVGASEFGFAPFLIYGRYEHHESPDAEVWLFPGSGSDAASFLLEAARELRGTYEPVLGAPALSRPRITAVRGLGASWGPPYCVLIDDGIVPRGTWQQKLAFATVAHELAHTWFGDSVAGRGELGYHHEAFAQYLSALAIGVRDGAAAEEDQYESWLVSYARGSEPLGSGLGALSMLERPEYVRGTYLVGPHFLRALEARLGRTVWHSVLRDFAQRFAGGAADLDDLRAAVRARAGAGADDLFADWLDSSRASDELYRRGRELIALREGYWRSREAQPDEALRAEVAAKRDEAALLLRTADLTSLPEAERLARASALLREMRYERDVQTTVLAADGTAVFHVQEGLIGSRLTHSDVRGQPVYAEILASEASRGEGANFDFYNETLEAARENALAFARLDDLGWTVIVEGHGWRAMP